jgi:hypothetical protein
MLGICQNQRQSSILRRPRSLSQCNDVPRLAGTRVSICSVESSGDLPGSSQLRRFLQFAVMISGYAASIVAAPTFR